MMTPALRRFMFTTHITSLVGWVGAALAFLHLPSFAPLAGALGFRRRLGPRTAESQ